MGKDEVCRDAIYCVCTLAKLTEGIARRKLCTDAMSGAQCQVVVSKGLVVASLITNYKLQIIKRFS